jgi:hypothetical protein
MLHHSHTKATIQIPVRAGAKLTVESVKNWTSEKPDAATLHAYLIVQGELHDNGQARTETWRFPITTVNLQALEAAFREILDYVNNRGMYRSGMKREAYAVVGERFRVGWVDENGEFYGYLSAVNDAKVMTSKFDNFDGLAEVRNAIKQALNQ